MRRYVTMRLPEELLAAVDAEAGPRGRTGFVVAALERALGGGAVPDGVRSAVCRVDELVAPVRAPVNESAVQRRIRLADERRVRGL